MQIGVSILFTALIDVMRSERNKVRNNGQQFDTFLLDDDNHISPDLTNNSFAWSPFTNRV